MKTIINRHLATLAALGFVLTAAACENGLTEANDNPNAPTDVGAEFLLPQSIRTTVQQAFGAGLHLSHTAIWPQQAVQIQYPDEEQGRVRSDGMQGFWDTYYAGPLTDIEAVISKGEAAGRPNIEAVGRIWRAYVFHLVTDLWGDVPYTEALRAGEGILTPTYDSQQAIYQSLLQELKEAAGMLQAGGAGFGSGDILYSNDFEKWRRFANSLRMRLAMRISEVDATRARSEFADAYSAGGFTSNADNAALRWPGAPYRNPLFENWQGRDDHGISRTMVDTLKSLGDPRLELYAEPAAIDGTYRGLQNNVRSPEFSLAWYSRIGRIFRQNGAATPTHLLTYAEVAFLEAEAAQRGWISGSAADFYTAGIRASMDQYDAQSPANNPTDAEIDAYLASQRVTYNSGTGIEQINLQKWIALFMNGSEAWANWRRIGVPNLQRGPDLGISRIPVRFPYPGGEQSLNADNLNAAVSRQGGGLDLVTPVWWQAH